jgi:hypothetical protein
MQLGKRIIFVNQSCGYLMVNIINAYVKAGYSCILITGLLVERTEFLHKTVMVHKIIRYDNTSYFKRLFTWFVGAVRTIWLLKTHYRKDELFIVSNPPFASLYPLVVRNPFSLLIFDVYPDVIAELGILKKESFIIRQWEKANRSIYPKAQHIFTITDGMKNLLSKYALHSKIVVVPLWSDNEFLRKIPREENHFIRRHGLEDKFVVLYSGNIGLASDVEILAEVAKHITDKDILFIVIGEGARKTFLETKVKKEKISNLNILPWQQVSELPFSLSAGNLAVVSLNQNASRLAIPSKLFSVLSIGIPILGIAGKDSDLYQFIEKNEIGKCFQSDSIMDIAGYIQEIKDHPWIGEKLSANAVSISQKYTRKNVTRFLNPEVNI